MGVTKYKNKNIEIIIQIQDNDGVNPMFFFVVVFIFQTNSNISLKGYVSLELFYHENISILQTIFYKNIF